MEFESPKGGKVPAVLLGFLLLATGISFFIPLDLELSDNRLFWLKINDVAHAPAFFVICLAIHFFVFRVLRNFWVSFITTILVATIASVMVEWLQPFFNRSRDFNDLVLGLYGIGAYAATAVIFRGFRSPLIRGGMVLSVLSAFALLAYPAIALWDSGVGPSAVFPDLGKFESDLDLKNWKTLKRHSEIGSTLEISQRRATDGHRSLHVMGVPGEMSGVVHFPVKKDWRPYRSICLQVHVDISTEMVLILEDELYDDTKSRYTAHVPVNGGWNEICLDFTALMTEDENWIVDLAKIRRFGIFTDDVANPSFYIDSVRLE